jgi:hypothetical protein
VSGSGTITKDARTPVWGQGFLRKRRIDRDDDQRPKSTDCPVTARSEPRTSLAVYITNIGWNYDRRDRPRFLRRTVTQLILDIASYFAP